VWGCVSRGDVFLGCCMVGVVCIVAYHPDGVTWIVVLYEFGEIGWGMVVAVVVVGGGGGCAHSCTVLCWCFSTRSYDGHAAECGRARLCV
jgi:hypothetical protein